MQNRAQSHPPRPAAAAATGEPVPAANRVGAGEGSDAATLRWHCRKVTNLPETASASHECFPYPAAVQLKRAILRQKSPSQSWPSRGRHHLCHKPAAQCLRARTATSSLSAGCQGFGPRPVRGAGVTICSPLIALQMQTEMRQDEQRRGPRRQPAGGHPAPAALPLLWALPGN